MLTQLLTIARNAFVESVRQPILFILILLSGVLQVFNTWNTGYSMGQELSGELTGDNKLMFDYGLATIFLLGTIAAGFVATAVMSREIENKTVLTVVSKPVGRPVLVIGKFLGVAGAVIGASFVMLIFLLLALRHGVMSTAADELDAPVLVFSLGTVALVLIISAWCNYFFGWNFAQSVVSLLIPGMTIAFILVLLVSKTWKFQSINTDLRPQVLVASACLLLAILVLTSIATAASTRLGQVMTILVCLGVFVMALLSNHLFGRRAFENAIVGIIAAAEPVDPEQPAFRTPGTQYQIALELPPNDPLTPGTPIYYSSSPSGFPMLTPGNYTRFTGNLAELSDQIGPGKPGAVIVTQSEGSRATIRNIGERGVPVYRPPERGDYVFTTPTTTHVAPLVAWGVIPNLQSFWLLDAVSQSRPVPPRYLGMVTLYAGCLIAASLSLGVILFQRRDVG